MLKYYHVTYAEQCSRGMFPLSSVFIIWHKRDTVSNQCSLSEEQEEWEEIVTAHVCSYAVPIVLSYNYKVQMDSPIMYLM